MKKLLLSLAVALALGFSAQAQFFGGVAGSSAVVSSSILPGTTNIILATSTNYITASTNAFVPLIRCYNNRQLGLTLTAGGNTNGPTVTCTFARSPDGVNWSEGPVSLWSMTMTAASGGTTTISTNIDVGAFQYIALYGFTNSAAITNFSLVYSLKPGY